MLHSPFNLAGTKSLQLAQRIWQVLPDLGTGRLLVAVRDGETRKVDVWMFDPEEGKGRVVAKDLDWWTQLAGAHGDVLLLSRYPEPSSPRMGGILALKTSTGEQLWGREDVQFRSVHPRGVAVLQGQEDVVLLDLLSGEVLAGDTEADSVWEEWVEQVLHYPRWCHAGEAEFEEWQRISGAKGQAICGWQKGDLAAFAWHEQEGDGSWRLELKAGEVEACLEKGMRAWHPEPFFVVGGRVVAIRDQRELLTIALLTTL